MIRTYRHSGMLIMQKILILLAILLLLTGCIHKMDIEQGNIIEQKKVKQLHSGMSQVDVKKIMGTPVLLNTFADNHIDYVYTFKPGHGQDMEKYIILIFQDDKLEKISGDRYS
jgi:outer membrane protein assembly factor BamE